QTPPPAPGSLNAQLDPAIDKIIQRALAKEPEQRFPSVLAFAQAFAPFQSLSDAQASTGKIPVVPKHVQPSPDETLIDSKPAAAFTRLSTQASPDATRPTQIASGSGAMSPDKSTQQISLSEASQNSAIIEANGGTPANNDDATSPATPPTVLAASAAVSTPANNGNAQSPATAPTVLAANAALSETLPPGSNGVAPTVLAANTAAPVLDRSAPPLPILQFHEPQAPFQLSAIQRKSISTLQKNLVIALIVLVVLAASGAFLFKNLAGHNVSAASSKSNENSPQANETMQVGQPLAGSGGINMITVTPTPTNTPTPTATTPGSQPGSAAGATSTQAPGGSTSPTARPTATPTPKPAPKPTPTPIIQLVCSGKLSSGWTSSKGGPAECQGKAWNATTPTSAYAVYSLGTVTVPRTYSLLAYVTASATAYMNYDPYVGNSVREACAFDSHVSPGWHYVCSFSVSAADVGKALSVHEWSGQKHSGLILVHSAIELEVANV
ncbi:MAG TPA: hypothetical protein VGM01_12495, partial [Ktedonobacteraceae bacterium]